MKTRKLLNFGAALLLSAASLMSAAPLAFANPLNCQWQGGGGNSNFSTVGNWTGCGGVAPVNGSNLIFDVTSLASSATLTDDISGLSVGTITFQGSNSNDSNFTISGSDALTITGGITVSDNDLYPTFENNLVVGGNIALTTTDNDNLTLEGDISGTGNVTLSGVGLFIFEGDNTFTGTVTANAGMLLAQSATALGNAANSVIINDGSDLTIGGCDDNGFTFPNNITLTGASSDPSGAYPTAKLMTGASCRGGGGGYDETYAQATTTTQSYTLSGTITLGSNVTYGGYAQTTTITGPMAGNFAFTLPNTWAGTLVVDSSANSSAMANGTYNSPPVDVTLSDSQPASTVYIGEGATVTVDGVRSDTIVDKGGTLKGDGTVGNLSVLGGGVVSPGHSPGCLTVSGNLDEGGTYQAEIGGATACTGYDQLDVTGTVTLDDGLSPPTKGKLQVSLVNGFKPKAGQTFEIINNKGSKAVSDTFSGLAQGATITVSGTVFKISYKGGTGNDVVLTVASVPTAPNTGLGLTSSHFELPILGGLMMASGLYYISRKVKFSTPAKRR